MTSPNNTSEISSARLLLRMLAFLRPVWRTAVVAALIVVLRVAAEVLAVYFLSPAVTTVATHMDSSHSSRLDSETFVTWISGASAAARELRQVLAWMLGAQVLLGVMVFLRATWDTKLSMHAVYFMRSAVYDRLQRAELTLYEKMTSGQLINRAISDLQNVRAFVNMSVLSSLDIVASLAFYLTLLCYRSPWLMVAALIPVPFWLMVIIRFGRRARPLCERQQHAADRLMGTLSENLYGVHVIRAFGTEQLEIEKYRARNQNLLRRLRASIRLQAHLTPGLKLIGMIAHLLLFVFSAWLIRNGQAQVGDVMILGAAMGALLAKLQLINLMAEAQQKAMVSARRLFAILDLPVAIASERCEARGLRLTSGEIEFQDVDFKFGTDWATIPVLHGITTRIPGGRVTALVGPTGAGKSTLAALIARFNEPTRGRILIDKQDLHEIDLHDLRQKVGYVFQETFLFTGTVRENILYGRSDVSEQMMHMAARISHADEFIARLPNGYDTVLGERGVLLSGGQRQRLALARALVYDPAILILDDATAALDMRTERAVHQELDSVFSGRTVLIIAHRLASVETADHVIVLDHGRIVQEGTHAALLQQEGHYRDIVRLNLLAETGVDVEQGSDVTPVPMQRGAV